MLMLRAMKLACQGIPPSSPKDTELNITLGGSGAEPESFE